MALSICPEKGETHQRHTGRSHPSRCRHRTSAPRSLRGICHTPPRPVLHRSDSISLVLGPDASLGIVIVAPRWDAIGTAEVAGHGSQQHVARDPATRNPSPREGDRRHCRYVRHAIALFTTSPSNRLSDAFTGVFPVSPSPAPEASAAEQCAHPSLARVAQSPRRAAAAWFLPRGSKGPTPRS